MEKAEPPKIEDTVFDYVLPCNTLAVLARLRRRMAELGTNSLMSASAKSDPVLRKLVWLVAAHFYGELATIDMPVVWRRMLRDFRSGSQVSARRLPPGGEKR